MRNSGTSQLTAKTCAYAPRNQSQEQSRHATSILSTSTSHYQKSSVPAQARTTNSITCVSTEKFIFQSRDFLLDSFQREIEIVNRLISIHRGRRLHV